VADSPYGGTTLKLGQSGPKQPKAMPIGYVNEQARGCLSLVSHVWRVSAVDFSR